MAHRPQPYRVHPRTSSARGGSCATGRRRQYPTSVARHRLDDKSATALATVPARAQTRHMAPGRSRRGERPQLALAALQNPVPFR